ncbi:MAG: FtsX-like permease family protein [bacterium]
MVSTSLLLGKINRRKIVKNFGQFFSIILITLLAVTLAVGLDSNARTLEGKLDYLLEETNFADGIVYGAIDDDDTHVFDILQYDYQKRLQLSATTKNSSVDLLISDGAATLNTPFTEDYSGGVYITHEFARIHKYNIGDILSLDVDFSMFSSALGSLFSSYEGAVNEGKENILNKDTITLEFVIDGLMYHSEGIVDTYPVSMSYSHFTDALEVVIKDNYRDTSPSWWDFTTSATIITTLETIMYDTYNSVLFIGDFDYIDNLYYFDTDDYYIFDTTYVSGVYQMRMDITQAYQLTYVFPVVFIIVSVLIIITTISQLIFKERLNIATLKSIGISNGKIYSHYIFLTITLCLIGGVIGSIVGPMILPGVMSMKYDMIYRVPVISNVYAIIPIVSNILLFIIISTIVSYKILKSSVIMPPAALIKHTGNHKFKKSKIKIKSWSVKIAFRNISQNVFRSLMVVIGVGGCSALFITGFGIDDTLNKTTTIDSEVVFPCDATITFNTYTYELGQSINELDSVLSYEEYVMKSTTIDSNVANVTNVFFIDSNTEFFNQGNFDGVYISSNLSKKFGLSVGDEISFSIGNTKYTYEIEYIIETGFNHGLFIPNDNVEYSTTHAWVNTTDQQELDNLLTSYPEISNVYTDIEWQKSCADAIAPISIIKITLQVFAFLLGVVVLFNLALLNFKEKSRDIATLKVLGLKNSEISKSLIIEMMVLAILGGLLGLSVGYPLMVLLLSINEVEFITYIYNLTPMSYLLTFVFTTLTALIINLMLFKQINKIKMVESLKSVE